MPRGILDQATGLLIGADWNPLTQGDVVLAAMPITPPPWTYDAVNRLALAHAPTMQEQLASVPMGPHLLAAIVLRLSSSWAGLTQVQKDKVQTVLDARASAVVAALS